MNIQRHLTVIQIMTFLSRVPNQPFYTEATTNISILAIACVMLASQIQKKDTANNLQLNSTSGSIQHGSYADSLSLTNPTSRTDPSCIPFLPTALTNKLVQLSFFV